MKKTKDFWQLSDLLKRSMVCSVTIVSSKHPWVLVNLRPNIGRGRLSTYVVKPSERILRPQRAGAYMGMNDCSGNYSATCIQRG